jgi:hypothetical protein
VRSAVAGIFHEISFGARISGNVLSGNCWRYAPWNAGGKAPWGGFCGQISLSTSQNVTVEGNEITVDPASGVYAAVTMYQETRGVDHHMVPNITYRLRGNTVQNNTITFKKGSTGHIRLGIMRFVNQSASQEPQWDDANIVFDGNDYVLEDAADLNDSSFLWCEGGDHCPTIRAHTFADFQALGQERHGRWGVTVV